MGFVAIDDVDCHQMLFLLHFLSFPLKRCQCFVCSEIYAFNRFDIVSKFYNASHVSSSSAICDAVFTYILN